MKSLPRALNFWLFALVILGAWAAIGSADASEPALELRVFPDGPIYAYQSDPARQRSNIVLHSLGVTNLASDEIEVSGVTFSLLEEGVVTQITTIGADEISQHAPSYRMAQQMGTFQRFDSVFGFTPLFGEGGRLSSARVLSEGRSLIFLSQYFSLNGNVDVLRVEVMAISQNGPVTTALDIPVVHYDPAAQYTFPLNGSWFVNVGPNHFSHHRWSQNSEFAIDAIRVGRNGRAFASDGQSVEDFYAFGAPVYAAAEGVVVAAMDGIGPAPLKGVDESFDDFFARMSARQSDLFAEDPLLAAGNFVIIEHEGGEHSVYGHLRQGSLQVAVGDRVLPGMQLGEIGNSGNSLEPHLHFQVMLGADRMWSRGVPVIFQGLAGRDSDVITRQLRSGDFVFSNHVE